MTVRLDHIEKITHDIVTYWFVPEHPFRYVAGQFIELSLPRSDHDERGDRRWFTLSSSPSESLLAITTRQSNNASSFKDHLSSLSPGDKASVSEPMGDFVLPKLASLPLTFVAAGIGCTPYRSMLQWLKDTQERRTITMLYVVSDKKEAAFAELFSDMTNFELLASKADQRLRAEHILEQSRANASEYIYLSGPERMIEQLVKELRALGVKSEQLITDYFHGYN